MNQEMSTNEPNITQLISEGSAVVKTTGNVFYNPVQEFNRDLRYHLIYLIRGITIQFSKSIAVLSVFATIFKVEKTQANKKNTPDINVNKEDERFTSKISCEGGITILEALSATGLRSIRYAKEIPNVKQIFANDISEKAVENIKQNVVDNNVANLVSVSNNDAM